MAHIDVPVRTMSASLSAPSARGMSGAQVAMGIFVIAVIPSALFGVYNTGHQANIAMAQLGVAAAPGWRGQLIELLGTGYDASDFWSAVVHGAIYFLPVLLVVIIAAGFWTGLFAAMRRRRVGPGVLGAALVVALLLPPTVPLWIAALGMSFGIIFGREIFGGFGRNVINPAVAALAFLHIAYPAEMMADRVWVPVEGYVRAAPLEIAQEGGAQALTEAGISWTDAFLGTIPGAFGETSALTALFGAAILVGTGWASWRVIAGIGLGAIVTVASFGFGGETALVANLPWTWHLVLGSFAFGAVFLAADPVTAASTNTGRWVYGLLIGIMAIVIRIAGPAHAEGMVFAILLGNIFAPTIDYAVMQANIRRRARRHVR